MISRDRIETIIIQALDSPFSRGQPKETLAKFIADTIIQAGMETYESPDIVIMKRNGINRKVCVKSYSRNMVMYEVVGTEEKGFMKLNEFVKVCDNQHLASALDYLEKKSNQ